MARLRRKLTRRGIRTFVKNYYELKRLIQDAQDDFVYGGELEEMAADFPETFARLEANWQANS